MNFLTLFGDCFLNVKGFVFFFLTKLIIDVPILLFHGLLSDVLTLKIVKNMKRSQPDMRVITINDCGHAPGLHIPQHYEPILKFLS